MSDANVSSAKFEDLLLSIARSGEYWRARVEEIDDPNSGLSDGIDHESPGKAKRGAMDIARELFGTNVREEELDWRYDW